MNPKSGIRTEVRIPLSLLKRNNRNGPIEKGHEFARAESAAKMSEGFEGCGRTPYRGRRVTAANVVSDHGSNRNEKSYPG